MTIVYVYFFFLLFAYLYHNCLYRPVRIFLSDNNEPVSSWPSVFVALLIILSVLLIRTFWLDFYRVPTSSMEPGYEVGSFVVANKASYNLVLPLSQYKVIDTGTPQRGDTVVVLNPRNPETTFFKRLIGVPGDIIEYKDKQLIINGIKARYSETDIPDHYQECFDKCYLVKRDPAVAPKDGTWTLQQGQYFVMGDNRDNSKDAREWGPLLERHLIGKVL